MNNIWKIWYDKYEYFTGEDILTHDQSTIIEQAKKFTHFSLGKALEKQTKTIKDQGQKQIKANEEHGKQLAGSNALFKKYDYDTEKDSPSFLK